MGGLVAIALLVFFLLPPIISQEPSVLVEIIPPPGPLPREFAALARFDKPLDKESVLDTLVYRIEQSGGYGPPHSVEAAGKLILKDGNRTLLFMVDPHNLPRIGTKIRIETSGIMGENGLLVGDLGLEYTISAMDPTPLYALLREHLSVTDLLRIWGEGLDSF